MVRFAILGAGSIARTMADTVNGMKGEIEPYAIAARDKDRAEAFRQQYGFTVSYGSYEEMLADPKVDLVYIAVPHSHHHRWTGDDRAGREKATPPDRSHLDPVSAIQEDHRRGGQKRNHRKHPHGLCQPRVSDLPCGAYAASGARRLDLSVYVLNFASMVLGDSIRKLTATCVKTDTGVDGQDNFCLEYENGAMASLFTTMYVPTNRMGLICGDKGFIEVENINNPQKITAFRQKGLWKNGNRQLERSKADHRLRIRGAGVHQGN